MDIVLSDVDGVVCWPIWRVTDAGGYERIDDEEEVKKRSLVGRLLNALKWNPLLWRYPFRRPYREVCRILSGFSQDGIKVIFVTRRPPHLGQVTNDLIRRGGWAGKIEIIHCPPGREVAHFKLERMQELGAICLIEDDTSIAQFVERHRQNVILMNRGYNRSVQDVVEGRSGAVVCKNNALAECLNHFRHRQSYQAPT